MRYTSFFAATIIKERSSSFGGGGVLVPCDIHYAYAFTIDCNVPVRVAAWPYRM